MGRGKDAKPKYTKWLRVTDDDYEIIHQLADARRRVSRAPQKIPAIAAAGADLFEIAYCCIHDHGTDFAQPYRPEARPRFKKLAARVLRPNRKRGERGPDRNPRRKRRAE